MKLKEITLIFEDARTTVKKTESGSYPISGSVPQDAKRTDIIMKASEIFKVFNKGN